MHSFFGDIVSAWWRFNLYFNSLVCILPPPRRCYITAQWTIWRCPIEWLYRLSPLILIACLRSWLVFQFQVINIRPFRKIYNTSVHFGPIWFNSIENAVCVFVSVVYILLNQIDFISRRWVLSLDSMSTVRQFRLFQRKVVLVQAWWYHFYSCLSIHNNMLIIHNSLIFFKRGFWFFFRNCNFWTNFKMTVFTLFKTLLLLILISNSIFKINAYTFSTLGNLHRFYVL